MKVSSRSAVIGFAIVGIAISAFSPGATAQESVGKIAKPAEESEGVPEEVDTRSTQTERPADSSGPGEVVRSQERTTRAPPPPMITSARYNCPLRPDDQDVAFLWQTARQKLQGQTSEDANCQNALSPLQASLASAETAAGLMSDPEEVNRQRLEQQEAALLALTANPALDPRGTERAILQEQIARLRQGIEERTTTRDNAVHDRAVQETLARVNAVLQAIPSVSAACQNSDDRQIASAAAQSGLQLFSAASPLLFGAGTGIGVISNLLSGVARALTGPSSSERALQNLTEIEDLANLGCYYFHVQKAYCDGVQSGAAGRNLRPLEDLREQLFEGSQRAFGKRMRDLFNEHYREPLGTYQRQDVPIYCAMMSAIPGESSMCTEANRAELGPAFGSCLYSNWEAAGRSDSARPAALSTSRAPATARGTSVRSNSRSGGADN